MCRDVDSFSLLFDFNPLYIIKITPETFLLFIFNNHFDFYKIRKVNFIFHYYLYFIIRWIICSEELSLISQPSATFEEVTHSHNKEPQLVESHKVKLRGIKINSTKTDSPNLIFIPDVFDRAENWLSFFSNPNNKVFFISY